MDKILAGDAVVDEAEAVVAGPADRSHVRIGRLSRAKLFGALHHLLEPPEALRGGGAAYGKADCRKQSDTGKETRRYHANPFATAWARFSLRLLNES
jgi:hypothetical protein